MAWPQDNLAGAAAMSVFAPHGAWVASSGPILNSNAYPLGAANIGYLDLPACQIDRLGFEVVTIGSTGALTRPCAWFDDGTGRPGLVAADGGQIATDGAPGIMSAVVAINHSGGRLWIAAVNQVGAPTAALRLLSGTGVQQVRSTQPTTEVGLCWLVAGMMGVPPNSPAGAYGVNATRCSVRIV
jgi:hypothetical protein